MSKAVDKSVNETGSKQTSGSNSKLAKSERITKQQLQILTLLYRFRFVSTRHVQTLLNRKQLQQAQQRLNLLLHKEYIGKNFSNIDRLTGTYASYYLLPKGGRLLKTHQQELEHGLDEDLSLTVLHNIYKDRTASKRFITHQLSLGDIHSELVRLHENKLEFFTKSELAGYDYYPNPSPDAFIRVYGAATSNKKPKQYFLEYLEDSVPFWVYRNRVKQYIEYAEAGNWEEAVDSTLPTILLICEGSTLQRRTIRYLKRAMQSTYVDIYFYVSSRELLMTSEEPSTLIWQFVDPEDADELKSAILEDNL